MHQLEPCKLKPQQVLCLLMKIKCLLFSNSWSLLIQPWLHCQNLNIVHLHMHYLRQLNIFRFQLLHFLTQWRSAWTKSNSTKFVSQCSSCLWQLLWGGWLPWRINKAPSTVKFLVSTQERSTNSLQVFLHLPHQYCISFCVPTQGWNPVHRITNLPTSSIKMESWARGCSSRAVYRSITPASTTCLSTMQQVLV